MNWLSTEGTSNSLQPVGNVILRILPEVLLFFVCGLNADILPVEYLPDVHNRRLDNVVVQGRCEPQEFAMRDDRLAHVGV